MDRQDELQAERAALEAGLLALEQVIQPHWLQGATVPAELGQRLEELLGRLKRVNAALTPPGASAST